MSLFHALIPYLFQIHLTTVLPTSPWSSSVYPFLVFLVEVYMHAVLHAQPILLRLITLIMFVGEYKL
jgi:hypothetical protein